MISKYTILYYILVYPGGGHVLALKIPMDIGVWQATVHGITESRTQLNN